MSDDTATRGSATLSSRDRQLAGLRPYPKGVSGNPTGRNPERDRLRQLVTERGQEALDGILELARSAQSEKVRLAAWIWMAEQVVGKATQIVTGADGGPIAIDTSSALLEALRRMATGRRADAEALPDALVLPDPASGERSEGDGGEGEGP